MEGRVSPVASTDDELRPVISLFADVVGSTSLGERLDPAEVKVLVGECVNRMCDAIEGLGGCVRSYMGDGVAGFFGIDTAREDDVERAARAALEIRRLAAEYSRDVANTWGIAGFSVRVGLNLGRAAVGMVGAKEPQRVALGDCVNVAARLQAAARPGAIVIGRSVAFALEGRFAVRPLGSLQVKGRTGSVEAFELLEEADRSDTPARTPFVAREAELAVLNGALADLRQGRGQVIFLKGDAGIGKSRLLSETCRRAGSDVAWLSGSCDGTDRRMPFEPFVQALRSWLGTSRRSPALETRVRLAARGQEMLGDRFEFCVGHLARLLGVSLNPRTDRSLEGLPADELALSLARAYGEWLVAVARHTPVVLVIDNFAAATPSTVDLACQLLPALDLAPILMVLPIRCDSGAVRTVRAQALTEFGHRYKEVQVGGLADADSKTLARCLDSGGGLDDRLVNLVCERAEGNPLYLEQLVAALADDAPVESDELSVLPNALEALLLSRIDALPSEAQSVLVSAAVLGRVFVRELLESMLSASVVEAALPALLRADIVRERGRVPARYEFRHGLLREAVLSLIPAARWRDLNARAAAALRSWSGFDIERDSQALADYHLGSGSVTDAVECLEYVADRFASVYRTNEAVDLYERCVRELTHSRGWPGALRLVTKAVDLLANQGAFDRAIAITDLVLSASVDDGALVDLLVIRANCLADMRASAEAQAALQEIARASGSRWLPEAILLEGRLALARRDLEAVDAALGRLGELDRLRLPLRFEAMSLAAGVCASRGELDAAERWCLGAEGIAGEMGQVSKQLTARRHTAIVCALKGCTEEAYEIARGVYRDCSRLELRVRKSEAAVDLMHVAHMLGELDEAEAVGRSVLDEGGDADWCDAVVANLACISWELGRYDEARRLASRALASSNYLPTLVSGRLMAIRRTSAVGLDVDFLHMADCYARARTELGEGHDEDDRVVVDARRAECELIAGDMRFATTFADARLQVRDRTAQIDIDRIRLWAVGKTTDAAEALQGLARLVDEAHARRFRLAKGRVLVALGDLSIESASSYLDEAEAIFEECNAAHALAELRQVRARSPVAARA